MTSQTKYYIELPDIKGLRFECKGCAAVLTLPIKADISKTLLRCPQCRKGWLELENSTNELLIQELARQIQAVALKSQEIGFRFSLELSSDPAASAKGA